MKKLRDALQIQTLFLMVVACLFLPKAIADDIEIYEHGGCEVPEIYRFIFIVDNSGSMSTLEFINSKRTIDASIAHVLNSGLPDVEVAVVQYGSNSRGTDHDYRITVPFTDNESDATDWGRDFGTGGLTNRFYIQDHQPASLAEMRRDNVYDAGGVLDVSDATNVQFVFFTDAWRDVSKTYSVCCSSIVADSRRHIPSYVASNFGEYNLLKNGSVLPNGMKAQFTVLHAAPNQEALRAGAAIASAGGDYNGSIEYDASDPDGGGVLPRRYILGDLSVNDTSKIVSMLDTVIEEISVATTLASPSVSASAFNETRHSDRLYYSLFQPGEKKSWTGNIKSYKIDDTGVIVDASGNRAVDPDTGSLYASSRSFWSSADDGSDVGNGGFAEQIAAGRSWYTEANGVFQKVLASAQVPAAAFGTNSNTVRDKAVNWALGYDSHDVDADSHTTESNHYMADSLHSSPLMVNYRKTATVSDDVLFATSNLGMLHAIEPTTGDELWAYTPSELLGNFLEFNEDRADINDHNYGLDGPLSFYEKTTSSSTTLTTLSTGYLYLTQRRGGDGIFALDVSRARETINPFSVLWKIDGGQGDFIDLGQSWSAPEIITVALNCDTTCEYRDVLLFSGGYNPDYDTPTYTFSTPASSGHGNALYMVDPETGALLWSAGKRSSNSLTLAMNDSMPAAPVSIDTDADGGVDIIFSTDISGRIWRIDLDKNAHNMSEVHASGGLIADLTRSGTESPRFFNRPDVVLSSSGASAAYFSIALGSGSRSSPLRDEDKSNSVYFIRDPWVQRSPFRLDSSGDMQPDYNYVDDGGSYKVIKRSNLVQISSSSGTLSYPTYGFYQDLTETGEKVLSPMVTTGGKTLLVTYVPPSSTSVSTDSCSYTLGVSRLYIYDIASHQFQTILSTGTGFIDIAAGIVSQALLVDTGGSNGVNVLMGLESISLNSLIDPSNNNLRKIKRTSWVELEKP